LAAPRRRGDEKHQRGEEPEAESDQRYHAHVGASRRLARRAASIVARAASRGGGSAALDRAGEAAIVFGVEPVGLEPPGDLERARMGGPHDVVEVAEAAGAGLAVELLEDERADAPAVRVGGDGEEDLGVTPDDVEPAVPDDLALVLDAPPVVGDERPLGERAV